MMCTGVFELPRTNFLHPLTTNFRSAVPINFRHALPAISDPHTIL